MSVMFYLLERKSLKKRPHLKDAVILVTTVLLLADALIISIVNQMYGV